VGRGVAVAGAEQFPEPLRVGDGREVLRLGPPQGPANTVARDPAPWVGNVKPFLVPDARMLRTDGPDRLGSREYARDFKEVKSLGSLTSTTRTADQTMAAVFWQAQPGGLYGGVMRSLSSRYGLSTAQNAYSTAQANVSQARAAVAQASASRGAARESWAANEALIAGTSVDTSPDVAAAKARLDQARLDLERTVIRAPIDGVVTNRQIQVGQRVAAGSAVMTIVPVSSAYVDANFKEGQLARVRPGQKVELKSDLYGGDVVYHGRVIGFSGGTGSAFALIPAQNATGNWIKVVQRLPVRIALDPKELAQHPLRVGLSMEAEIDVSEK